MIQVKQSVNVINTEKVSLWLQLIFIKYLAIVLIDVNIDDSI